MLIYHYLSLQGASGGQEVDDMIRQYMSTGDEEAREGEGEAVVCSSTNSRARNPRRKKANLKGMSEEERKIHERKRNAESSKRSREKSKQIESDIYHDYFYEKERNEELKRIHRNLEKERDDQTRKLQGYSGNPK